MEDLRLAELLAGLSLVTDLGMGFPPDEAMRSCLVATHLARRMDLPDKTAACAYYTALLQHAGCTAYAHETAVLWGGNDIAVNSAGSRTDFNRPGEIFSKLLPEIAGGTREAFDPEVVRAVLEAAGHERVQVPKELPAGLSDREVEVLRLLTRGLTVREVGRRLFISPKTADRHAQNIYAKIGVSSRAAAAMFAMQHDLVRP